MALSCFGTNAQRSLGFVAADSNFVLNRATTSYRKPLATITMKHPTLLLLTVLIYSCSTNFNKNRNENLSIKDASRCNSNQNLKIQTKNSIGINLIDFKKRSDSLITLILNKPTSFEILTDTIRASNLESNQKSYLSSLEYLLVRKSNLFIRHFFKLEKPNNLLSFNLFEVFYNSYDSLNSSFSILKKSSSGIIKDDDSILNVPGLTYQNDYLLKSDRYLIWLNSGCVYGFKNHLKFAIALKESLKNIVAQDSIVCECGKIKCK
jgi:hypothetical protein